MLWCWKLDLKDCSGFLLIEYMWYLRPCLFKTIAIFNPPVPTQIPPFQTLVWKSGSNSLDTPTTPISTKTYSNFCHDPGSFFFMGESKFLRLLNNLQRWLWTKNLFMCSPNLWWDFEEIGVFDWAAILLSEGR